MQKLIRIGCVSVVCIVSFSSHAQDELRAASERYYEQLFGSVSILSDSDLISLGFKSFDPNSVFNSDNDQFGNQEALDNRQQISVYNLPLHFDIAGASDYFQNKITLKLGYFSLEEDVALVDNVPKDKMQQDVYSLYLGYSLESSLSQHWTLSYGIGSYLMYSKNDYHFNSPESRIYQPFFDDGFTNMSVWSTMIEPHIELQYQDDTEWGKWRAYSQWHYFYGANWHDGQQYGNPNGWRVSNGVQVEYDLAHFEQFKPALYASFKRVDIGRDATSLLQTNAYYETGLGVVWSNLFKWQWIDTVGIGVNFNYGSSLRGGSLLLYINPF